MYLEEGGGAGLPDHGKDISSVHDFALLSCLETSAARVLRSSMFSCLVYHMWYRDSWSTSIDSVIRHFSFELPHYAHLLMLLSSWDMFAGGGRGGERGVCSWVCNAIMKHGCMNATIKNAFLYTTIMDHTMMLTLRSGMPHQVQKWCTLLCLSACASRLRYLLIISGPCLVWLFHSCVILFDGQSARSLRERIGADWKARISFSWAFSNIAAFILVVEVYSYLPHVWCASS